MSATDQQSGQASGRPAIVLVHGAFADASSWNGVIERLQQRGYTVIAPANRCAAWRPMRPTWPACSARSTRPASRR